MSWRIIIISSQAKLDYKMGYLVVRSKETKRISLDEIGKLLIENPAVSITGCLIEALTEKKINVIFCDSKRSPVAELVPHHGSHDSTSKIKAQIAWMPKTKILIWQEIVSEKIRKQSEFLNEIGKGTESELLSSYLGQIEAADATNREGHAAKVYFNALFGMDFTRSALNSINAALNYGYSLILSSFNREISANGYLTQLGIFHDNMFNYFNLSCDLMEPFRIIIDRMVFKDIPEEFEKDEKHRMWKIFDERFLIDSKHQSLRNVIKIYTKSVFDAINDGDPSKIRFYEFYRHK